VSSRQTAWEKGSIYVHILQSCALLFTVLTTDMRTLSRATHIRTNIHANQMRSRTSFSHSTEPRADKSPKTEALLSDVPLSRHDLKGRMPVMNKQKNETKKVLKVMAVVCVCVCVCLLRLEVVLLLLQCDG